MSSREQSFTRICLQSVPLIPAHVTANARLILLTHPARSITLFHRWTLDLALELELDLSLLLQH